MKNLKALTLMAPAILAGLGAAIFAASWVAEQGNIASTKVVVAAVDIELGARSIPRCSPASTGRRDRSAGRLHR